MLSPAYLIDCAESYAFLFSQLESDICADISRRLVKNGGHMTQTTQWQMKKLKELRLAYDSVAREIISTNKSAEKVLRSTMLAGAAEALRFDDAIYRAIGVMPTDVASSKALQKVILAGIKKTNGTMVNLTGTTANTASKAFENALDRAYLQVISGAFSPDQAIRSVVNDLGRQGYEKIAYPSGTVTHLDSAARSALITGLNQTTAELQLMQAEETGTDLVEVSAHSGARPSHAEWQGGIYSISGHNHKYPDLVAATGYGSGEGLCGWNCYHNFYPFYEGVSTPTFTPGRFADPTGKSNEQVYEESQEQRYYERQVRYAKQECVTLDAAWQEADTQEAKAAYKSDFDRASAKLKRREAVLYKFCHDTKRTMYKDRVAVYGFDRSRSMKAVWGNRRYTSK